MMDSITKIQYKQAENYRKIIAEKIPAGSIIPAHTEQGHFYRVGEKTYPSVTGALQILKDPSLANWKLNTGMDYIRKQLLSLDTPTLLDLDEVVLDIIINNAKNAPQEIFEEAGDIGTQIHDARQDYFQRWINCQTRPEIITVGGIQDPRLISGMRALNKFCDDTGYIPVATELLLWSEKLGVAGTLDDLGIIDGKLVLCDLKSSNQFRDTYFLQVAMYYQMLVERTGSKRSSLRCTLSKSKNSSKSSFNSFKLSSVMPLTHLNVSLMSDSSSRLLSKSNSSSFKAYALNATSTLPPKT